MTETLPVLPLRDIVVFPHMIVPLFVGREKSVAALEAVMAGDKSGLPRRPTRTRDEDPGGVRRCTISASLATVLQLLKLPDGTVQACWSRASSARPSRNWRADGATSCSAATVTLIVDDEEPEGRRGAGAGPLGGQAVRGNYVRLNKKTARRDLAVQIGQIEDAGQASPTPSPPTSTVKIADKQALLRSRPIRSSASRCRFGFMEGEMGVLKVEKKIRSPRQAPDGEDAARILSQRADEGDPARARLGRRRAEGNETAEIEAEDRQAPSSPRRRATKVDRRS